MLTQVPPPPSLPQPRRLNSRRNPHWATNFPPTYPALPPSLSLSLELKLFSITLHHLCFTPSFSLLFLLFSNLYSSNPATVFKQPRGTSLKTVLFSLCLKGLALPYFFLSLSLARLLSCYSLLPVMWQNSDDKQTQNCWKSISLSWLPVISAVQARRAAPDEPMSGVQSPSRASESGLTTAWLTDVDLR